jgi:hypothetical protein
MIIGSYRSNEVDEEHMLSTKIQELSEKREGYLFNTTNIELENLVLGDACKIIMAMLTIDDEDKIRGLAKVCHKRTNGNPHFFISFVAMLEEEELISFNLGTMQWVWDENKIEEKIMSTENVVDLLQARMRKLSEESQILLQYAACLGSTFRSAILEVIWTKHEKLDEFSNEKGQNIDLSAFLDEMESKEFIESCGVGMFRWVHDKVQEASLSLGDASKPSFQFEVGTTLFHTLSNEELEHSLLR